MTHLFRNLSLAILLASVPSAILADVRGPMADINGVTDNTPDSIARARMARPAPGSTRRGDNPVLFLVGNSTMRCGTLGNGNSGQWGWGYFMADHFDPARISVENQALGGMSSRTFYRKLWPEIAAAIRPGDWVIIELGHNDNGPYDHGRARASIPGTGRDSLVVTIRETGVRDTVYTYGEYMRRFVCETRARGGRPVLFSLTPRNAYDPSDPSRIARYDSTFTAWAREVAEAEGVPFVNLNEISARKLERYGRRKTDGMFYADKIHSSVYGARMNAASAAEGIRTCRGLPLADYLLPPAPQPAPRVTPHTVTLADSTLSTRRLLDGGAWERFMSGVIPGDTVCMKFSTADLASPDAGGTLPGTGDESHVYRQGKDGPYTAVHTYGWYLRRFVDDLREAGATPVFMAPAPRKTTSPDLLLLRIWTQHVATAEGVDFREK